jgi:predicted RNase H-like HicB family nuclease
MGQRRRCLPSSICAGVQIGFAKNWGSGHKIEVVRYELIIYWSKEDNSFVVEVPELPGCMADGQTYAEAVANAEAVIDEWIETARSLGRPIPEPRGKLAYA